MTFLGHCNKFYLSSTGVGLAATILPSLWALRRWWLRLLELRYRFVQPPMAHTNSRTSLLPFVLLLFSSKLCPGAPEPMIWWNLLVSKEDDRLNIHKYTGSGIPRIYFSILLGALSTLLVAHESIESLSTSSLSSSLPSESRNENVNHISIFPSFLSFTCWSGTERNRWWIDRFPTMIFV